MIQALETERATPLETVERWCGAHGGRLAQIASEQTRNGELVRDALQEVWLGLCTLGPPDEVAADPQRLFAWLLIAVRRRVVDLLRRECLRSHRPLDEAADFAKDTPTEAARREEGERVRSVMDSLAANCEGDARLLELRYFDDHSVAQIAELLGLTPRAVSARLQRAKRKFRDAWLAGGGVIAIERAEHFGRIFASHFGVSCDYSVTGILQEVRHETQTREGGSALPHAHVPDGRKLNRLGCEVSHKSGQTED